MAIVIPPGFAAVSVPIKNAALSRTAYVTYAVANESGDPDPDALAEQCQQRIGNSWGLRIDTNCTIGPVRVSVGQDGGDPLLGFAEASFQGGRTLNSPTPAIALLTHKRTQLGGRRGRGFCYFPWAVAEDALNEAGTVNAAEVTGWNDALALFRAGHVTNEIPLVLLHGTGVTLPPDPTPITNWTCDPTISNQVRRQTR